MKKLLILLLFTTFFIMPAGISQAFRIKDISSIEGVRENMLIGYGLIVGLNGTGDKQGTEFTIQSLSTMLAKMGITVNPEDIKVKNVAAVIASSSLPTFTSPGSKIDVLVSSIGDATNLQGGTLLFTPLRGPDGHIYAIAQGSLSIGGFTGGSGGNSVQKNHPTVGRIPGGAIVEKVVPTDFATKGTLLLNLYSPDFTTAQTLADKINYTLNNKLAHPLNASSIEVVIPESFRNDPVRFISQIEKLDITIDQKAKIVLNERTGTIIMGEHVRISKIAISHGNLTIEINTDFQVSQPAPFSKGQTVITPQTGVRVSEEKAQLIFMPEGVNLKEVIAGLNAIGVTPRDLIAILQAMKAAGVLQAELEII